MTKTAQRISYFDNLKGILIILVVFAHCLYDYQGFHYVNLVTDTIYVFHMPAFVFVTGFLSKSEHSRSKEPLGRLLAAYLIFNTFMLLYELVKNGASMSLLTPYYSCWYLLAVIAWRAVSGWASRQKGVMLWSLLLALSAGFFVDVSNLLSVGRIIAFYPFFLAGFLLPAEKLPVKNKSGALCFKGAALTAVSVALAALFVYRHKISDSILLMNGYADASGLLCRVIIFAVSALFILGLCVCIPDRKLPFITKMGRNSLAIYLLHRILTLWAQELEIFTEDWQIFCYAAVLTAAICLLTGADRTSRLVDRLIVCFADAFSGGKEKRRHWCRLISGTVAAAILLYSPVKSIISAVRTAQMTDDVTASGEQQGGDVLYTQLTYEQSEKLHSDYRLLFAGDLIMLEDQVKRGWDGEKYCFDDIFEHTREYISGADFAIGVFEGPAAGEDAGYSTSNYDDGKTLALNYPDEFADAVKNAGFDLVTTANNHLLDKGVEGALRTLDVLDEAGLDHVGSYRNAEEKSAVKIVEQGGMKFAVLAYTYGSNGYSERQLLSDELSYLTSITVDPRSSSADQVRQMIAEDFARAKAEEPDAVIVLSHMGTQFDDYPDDYQEYWYDHFIECGADVILNDHTHSVQPVEISERDGRTVAIVNCPGNFANIYREYNGDASALTEIYFDRDSKEITGAAVIPMWTQSQLSGNYRALPIYDILHDTQLRAELSTYDLERVEQVQQHITEIMLGCNVPCSAAERRYFITDSGYMAQPAEPVALTEEEKASPLYQKLSEAESVCFVGDSITHGTKNGGFGWYRPLESLLNNVTECAAGGATTKSILPEAPTGSGMYVVALGTNDIRYRDEDICAMTAEDYIAELERFVQRVRSENSGAEFAFIAPWTSLDNDSVSKLSTAERNRMNGEYTEKLRAWCGENGHLFSDPNDIIDEVMCREVQSDYLVDYIHPNRNAGIELYTRAVLAGSQPVL